MNDRTVRVALGRHCDASDAHEIYREDAVLDYPQSGERIRGRNNIQESRSVQPNKKRFTLQRIIGSGDLWVGVSASGLKSVCVATSLRPPLLARGRKRVPCNLKVLENRPSGLISFPLCFVSVARHL